MKPSVFAISTLMLSLAILVARSAHAGPMLPCLPAALSANGNILVLNDRTYDDPDETHVRHVKTSTYRIIRKYVDLNYGLRLNGPETYFADPLWEVVFPDHGKPPFLDCGYTLVTDDGEYLVFVHDSWMLKPGLSIFRRRDHPGQPFGGPGPDHGVLIRDITLPEYLPRSKDNPSFIVMTDHTPQWYAGGHFAFSPDNQTLTFTDKAGASLQFTLATGAIHRP